jgi:RND superfamily putative drug exporter
MWIVALVAVIALSRVFGGAYATDFSLPGTESQRAFDLLQQRFPTQSGGTADIVFKADQGATNAAVKAAMLHLFGQVAALPGVVSVTSPYAPGTRAISPDGKIAFAQIQFREQPQDVPKAVVDHLLALGAAAQKQGLQIEFGGQVIDQSEFKPPGGAETVGILAALLILLFTFGSLVAAGLPIMTALFGVGTGTALLLLAANFIKVANVSTEIAAMIGIGVGIDYALFIITRYRSTLQDGVEPLEAVETALATSGRAVVLAGTIVVISMLGILLMGFTFVQGIAVGGAAAVFATMLAAITLLPAMLGFAGRKIDRLRVPGWGRGKATRDQGFWYRWSRLIQRRPWPALVVSLGLLLLLAWPFLSIRLGAADDGNNPTSLTTRRAYDLIAEGFGPGFNGPLILAAELSNRGQAAALNPLVGALKSTPGVAAVSPPIVSPKGNAAVITVYPTTSPQDAATTDLVHTLRDHVIPSTMTGTGVNVLVGGATAAIVDFSQKIAARLPVLIAVVVGLSFLLLMAVFRSILVPVKAAIMNLLSIGAAYGVMVAVFQWGWGGRVIGVDKAGPIEAWVPMMMFTILFGLSMDYEIFLLSRIREEYVVSGDNAEAVANGVALTGRVITAAAAIMIAVFFSFVVGFDMRQIKEIGFGLAVAVLVDATIVRMVLVPATMELLGNANWWFPDWLSRRVPRIGVEPQMAPNTIREPVSADR